MPLKKQLAPLKKTWKNFSQPTNLTKTVPIRPFSQSLWTGKSMNTEQHLHASTRGQQTQFDEKYFITQDIYFRYLTSIKTITRLFSFK